jgi:hypothetical protein
MDFEPQAEHRWLQKFVGEWTYEGEANCPDQPPIKSTGRETVRSLGGIWIVGEGTGKMPDGKDAVMIITLGFDAAKKRYVGTWIGSMMPNLWIYDGEVDAAGKKISLHSVGPSFTGEGQSNYIDAFEFVSDDHRVMTASVQGTDGQWTSFMTTHYRRVK